MKDSRGLRSDGVGLRTTSESEKYKLGFIIEATQMALCVGDFVHANPDGEVCTVVRAPLWLHHVTQSRSRGPFFVNELNPYGGRG